MKHVKAINLKAPEEEPSEEMDLFAMIDFPDPTGCDRIGYTPPPTQDPDATPCGNWNEGWEPTCESNCSNSAGNPDFCDLNCCSTDFGYPGCTEENCLCFVGPSV
ncbi:MAG: hypothetical protein GF311_00505 [Candidatus Lokiarchaeota archaeon]|nr:hypothetical protein [Candidatus Lokiarchaeota archaeon]